MVLKIIFHILKIHTFHQSKKHFHLIIQILFFYAELF